MKLIRAGILTIVLAFTASYAFSQSKGDKILGTYKAFGQDTDVWSKVLFSKTGDNTYEGRVIWVEDKGLYDADGNLMLDTRNADPELRSTPVDQIKVVWNISYDAKKDAWRGGKIYNPVDGKTYDVQISFENPEQIKLRGFVGTTVLGRNFYWDKVSE